MTVLKRLLVSPSVADLRTLLETMLVIVATWLLLGWLSSRPITQADGTWLVAPYTQSALDAGVDWTQHLYRFGVVGGSEMHPFAGTTPLLQLCSALGLSTTTTLDLTTMFLQLCFAMFGLQLARAIVTVSTGAERTLSLPERVVSVWICGFAPVLGWRLAIGHDNLVLGLLPLLVTLSLLWTARSRMPSVTMLLLGAFAAACGVSGLGAQSLLNSAVFGAPLVVATVLTAPRGARWGRAQWVVTAAVLGGLLVMLPRLVGMIEHALGDDATRGLGAAVTYSYGAASGFDWLGSIPWSTVGHDPVALHERNFPIGPLILIACVLWPSGVSRKLAWAALASGAIAILFACDLPPVSTGVLEVIRPLRAFRVPARAILPIVMFLPSIALAAWWSVGAHEALTRDGRTRYWLAVFGGAVVILVLRERLGGAREVLGWLACAALALGARWRPELLARYALALAFPMVAALGVVAFDERFPRGAPRDPIEAGPATLGVAVRNGASEQLTSALDRVELIDAPPPYEMSTAFAARLPSIDGMWYPPKRFLALLSEIQDKPLPATTAVFKLGRSRAFKLLQQLYNVRIGVAWGAEAGPALEVLPATPGAAWFPSRIATINHPSDMIRALAAAPDLRAALVDTAWVLTADAPVAAPVGCPGAQVTNVATDTIGQTATIRLRTTSACTLIVSTSYVRVLRATATVGETALSAAVFPIDIALTGITVPAGATTITLRPEASIPGWSRIAQALGLLLLAASIAIAARSQSPAP